MSELGARVGHLGIALTIILGVYSQVVIKWQMNVAGDLPVDIFGKLKFLLLMLLNPWIITSMVATFGAGLSWMLVMSKFDLSYAYPFISVMFVLMMIASVIFFNEPITAGKTLGMLLIVCGIFILGKG